MRLKNENVEGLMSIANFNLTATASQRKKNFISTRSARNRGKEQNKLLPIYEHTSVC